MEGAHNRRLEIGPGRAAHRAGSAAQRPVSDLAAQRERRHGVVLERELLPLLSGGIRRLVPALPLERGVNPVERLEALADRADRGLRPDRAQAPALDRDPARIEPRGEARRRAVVVPVIARGERVLVEPRARHFPVDPQRAEEPRRAAQVEELLRAGDRDGAARDVGAEVLAAVAIEPGPVGRQGVGVLSPSRPDARELDLVVAVRGTEVDPVRVRGIGDVPCVRAQPRAGVAHPAWKRHRRGVAQPAQRGPVAGGELGAERMLRIVPLVHVAREPRASAQPSLRRRGIEAPAVSARGGLEIDRDPALRRDRVADRERHRPGSVVDHVVVVRSALQPRAVQPDHLRAGHHARPVGRDAPARERVRALAALLAAELDRPLLALRVRRGHVPCCSPRARVAAHALEVAGDLRELAGDAVEKEIAHRCFGPRRPDRERELVQIVELPARAVGLERQPAIAHHGGHLDVLRDPSADREVEGLLERRGPVLPHLDAERLETAERNPLAGRIGERGRGARGRAGARSGNATRYQAVRGRARLLLDQGPDRAEREERWGAIHREVDDHAVRRLGQPAGMKRGRGPPESASG